MSNTNTLLNRKPQVQARVGQAGQRDLESEARTPSTRSMRTVGHRWSTMHMSRAYVPTM